MASSTSTPLLSASLPLAPPHPAVAHPAMLHNTLSALLVSVANRYAELSPADVSIGIGGGRLIIDDVKLRADVFNSPALPFRVHEGRAGRLRVDVPWSALSHAPVKVYLENVHLIAAPKQAPPQKPGFVSAHFPPPPPPPPPPQHPAHDAVAEEAKKGDWHQTMLGRLLFNVSVELYGLKVEYRDPECVGIISVASLRAFSAGPDWQSRFVSLVADSDPRRADSTTAVPMRKLVKVAGLHWLMIPRRPDDPSDDLRHQPQLDRDSFESKSPILDGIAVTVRVLLCTGTAYTTAHPGRLTPGLHAEIDVDLEDPIVNLTARQIKWIDHIIKQGFGVRARIPRSSSQQTSVLDRSPSMSTKRRPRPVYPQLSQQSPQRTKDANGMPYGDSSLNGMQYSPRMLSEPSHVPPPPSDTDSYYSVPNKPLVRDVYADEQVDAEIEEISDFEDEGHEEEEEEENYEGDEYINPKDDANQKPPRGGLQSLWRAIISENGDETVDDAAIALGLSNVDASEDENEESFEEAEEDATDYQYARQAVEAAANAGGLTMQIRMKTPDTAAWDLVDSLRDELRVEKDVRRRLENLETVLEEAELRVRESEEESRVLKERNLALIQELQDLERMTSQAGKNKDAMIRQMEAALSKAERNLQSMFQAQFNQQDVSRRQTPMAPLPQHVMDPPPSLQPPAVADEQGEMTDKGEGSDTTKVVPLDTEAETVVDVETESTVPSTDDRENGDGYVEKSMEATIVNVNMTEALPAAKEVVIDIPLEEVGPRTIALPSEMTEVPIGPPSDNYFSKMNAQKLQEAISSDGLTLI